MKFYLDKRYFVFPLFSLLFITLPVYSTMETADPGAASVLALVIPTLLFGLKYLKLQLKPYHISAIFMWLLCMMVTIAGPFSAQTNLMQTVKYLAFVVFFIVVSTYRFTEKDIVFVAKGYVYLAIVIALLIILSYLGGYQHVHEEVGESVYYLGRYSIGITGLYKNPNYLASFICVASFVVLYKMKETTMPFKKQMSHLVVFILFFVACFLTGTRISLIVLFISIIAVYGSALHHISLKGLLFPISLICVLLFLYGNQISDLMDLYLAGRDMFGDEGREEAWALAFRFFYDNFFLGGGIDCWHHMSRGYNTMNNLHNVFLEFLLNQGVIGALLLVLTLFYGCSKVKKTDRFFLIMLFLVTAIPISFQNGVVAVNFWRFVIINRLAMNYSIRSKEGICALFKVIQ